MLHQNYNCEYCGQLICEIDEDPRNPQVEYWESHVYSCPKQPTIKCDRGHNNKVLVMKYEGCQQCQLDIQEAQAQELYCIRCGKQSKKKLVDSDESYNDYECLECHAKIREFIEVPE